ncbi:hypothetical protein GF322_00080 [Candidatus Dependentiae bacterium]|nr:hypothetical protein [Candidatus Dependentiae bacterium]
MWYECLHDNFFIKQLYNKIPELVDVGINKINLTRGGYYLSICFDLAYADNPPKKWLNHNYNVVIVEVEFFSIKRIMLQTELYDYLKGNIDIFLDSNQLIHMNISGNITAQVVAVGGTIKKISPCLVDPSSAEY